MSTENRKRLEFTPEELAGMSLNDRALVANINDDRGSFGHLFEQDEQISVEEMSPAGRVAEILDERDDLAEGLKDRILNSVKGLELDVPGSLDEFYRKLRKEDVGYLEEAVALATDSELPIYLIMMSYDNEVREAVL